MIKQIKIVDFEGYIRCKADFGEIMVSCNKISCIFEQGITLLNGDVDSGSWGISYIISMMSQFPKPSDDFIFFTDLNLYINDKRSSVEQINDISCYMDLTYSNFNKELTVSESVEKYLAINNTLGFSSEDLRNIFMIDKQRYNYPLKGVGNARFRCMAAIGCAMNKSVFCFPWVSKRMMNYYGKNLSCALESLKMLGKIILLPSNGECDSDSVIGFY